MKLRSMCLVVTSLIFMAMTLVVATPAGAQCATCPAPTVAYQPVSAVQTVAYQPSTGWYPGKWLDQWRLRRYSRAATTTGYAPYSVGYTPYSAGFTPYTAAYRPYLTSYAPLAVPAVAPCNSCVQTVARPVMLSPVCQTCQAVSPCCDTGCSACSTCNTGVSQAVFSSEPTCSSCAAGATSGVIQKRAPRASVGPPTGTPSLPTEEAAPVSSFYPPEGSEKSQDDPDPLNGLGPVPEKEEAESSTSLEAPRLYQPGDRTAQRTTSNRPTVDVWNAVYRQSVAKRPFVRQTSARVSTPAPIAGGSGWHSVPRN